MGFVTAKASFERIEAELAKIKIQGNRTDGTSLSFVVSPDE